MKKILALLVCLMLAISSMVVIAEEAPATSVTIAIGSQFTTLDPALNTEVVNNYVNSHIYAGLFDVDENNQVVNDLCADYTVDESGLVYTFTIRDDAVWSDGVPVTAHDFVYSYLRALSYGADNAWAINDLVNFVEGAADYNLNALTVGESFDCTVEDASSVGIKAINDKTLEIKLFKPCAYFLRLLGANVWLPVRADFAPQHESLWAFEAGYPSCGAYTLVECNESENAIIAKSETYYGADSVLMDQIEYLVITDAASQAFALKNGEIDIAMTISSETALTYAGTENLWVMPQASNYFLAINSGSTGPDWAKDANVRRALALAINKEALVDVLGGATLYPPLNGYVPTGVGGISGDFRAEGDADGYTLKYDPEQAKQLLADAGYTEENPLKITYKYSNNGIHGDVATMLQAMWQAIGVEATFDAVESGVFYDQVDQGDFEICRYGYVASDDAMQYLVLWTTAIQVVAAVDDPEFDKMVDEAQKITDTTEYYTELHKLEDYLCEENVYVIPLFNYTTPVLVQSGVTGYRSMGGTANFAQVVIAE